MLSFIGFLPVGVEGLVRTAIADTGRRTRAVPLVVVALSLLALIPAGQAAVELIVHPVTVADVVDRRAYSSTLVALDARCWSCRFPERPEGASTGTPWATA